jgi:hypothetical protein
VTVIEASSKTVTADEMLAATRRALAWVHQQSLTTKEIAHGCADICTRQDVRITSCKCLQEFLERGEINAFAVEMRTREPGVYI